MSLYWFDFWLEGSGLSVSDLGVLPVGSAVTDRRVAWVKTGDPESHPWTQVGDDIRAQSEVLDQRAVLWSMPVPSSHDRRLTPEALAELPWRSVITDATGRYWFRGWVPEEMGPGTSLAPGRHWVSVGDQLTAADFDEEMWLVSLPSDDFVDVEQPALDAGAIDVEATEVGSELVEREG